MNTIPHTHNIGMSLEGMSAQELEARLVILFDEMQRVKLAADAQQRAEGKLPSNGMNEVFQSQFPRLLNPDLGK
ncbi:hypothetical protein [Maritalea sp.]|uniref:hypothetical protein n=1 Tax=Maritalea sp. TaxID=2003361 RepID=UPI003EF98536